MHHNISHFFSKFIIVFALTSALMACSSGPKENQRQMQHNQEEEANIPPVQVAIIMPLSGPEESLGLQYAAMAKQGLTESAKTKLQIHIYDGASASALDESINKILDNGIDIVIGPVYSEATKIATAKLAHIGIPIISLSNNPALATPNTYVFGHAPMRQLETMSNYLLSHGYKNYIILLPDGNYSRSVSQVLEQNILSQGGNHIITEYYSPDQNSMKQAAYNAAAAVDHVNENPFEDKKPVIIIADDSRALAHLLPHMQHYQLDKKAIIAGDGRLDLGGELANIDIMFTGSENLLKVRVPLLASARADAISATHPHNVNAMRSDIKHLSLMHILAYDAGKVVATAIGDKYNRKFFKKILSDTQYADAASSNMIYFVDNIALRRYDILHKSNGNYIVYESITSQ